MKDAARAFICLTVIGCAVVIGVAPCTPASTTEPPDLGEVFKGLRPGMGEKQVEVLFGVPETASEFEDRDGKCLVWAWKYKEGWLRGKATVIVMFEEGRVKMAAHTAEDVDDVENWVRAKRKEKHGAGDAPAGLPIEPAASVVALAWDRLAGIFDELKESGGLEERIDPENVARFDSISLEMTYDQIVERIGPSTSQTQHGAERIYYWEWGNEMASVSFKNGGVLYKRFRTPNKDIRVLPDGWRAVDGEVEVVTHADPD